MQTFWAWVLALIIMIVCILLGGIPGLIIGTIALGITGSAWLKARAPPQSIF